MSFSPVLAQTADVIYHNGSILTMAGTDPAYVEAIAVKDGKILLAGSKRQALSSKGEATRIVDLGGKALLPGFIDGHSHYINSLLVANQCKLYAPPVGPGKDVPSIIAELRKFAQERQIPKGQMIMGYGYDDTVMPQGRLLNRDDLDEAFPDHPVKIEHVSMHGGVLNSLALKKYGYSAETKTPPGGIIVRKPGSDEPWGLIMETAYLPVVEKSEPMTAQQEIECTRAGQMLYAEAGVTTAHEGLTHLPQFQTMRRAAAAGANIIDFVILEKDPLIVDPQAIKDIAVVETIKEGTTIYPARKGDNPIVAAPPGNAEKTYTWRPHACDMAHVNSAANREWILTTLLDKKVTAAKPPTMLFSRGKVALFGGVNRMSGSYALVRDSVMLGDLASTRMAGPPDLQELERVLALTLASVDGFHVHGNQLSLLRKGAVVATFRAKD